MVEESQLRHVFHLDISHFLVFSTPDAARGRLLTHKHMRSDGKKRESLKNDTPSGWQVGGRARGMDEFGAKLFRICPKGDKGRRGGRKLWMRS